MANQIKQVLRPGFLALSFLIGVALFCVIGFARADAALSPADAEVTCAYWASQYRDITLLRAQGAPRELLEETVSDAIASGQIPEEARQSFMYAIDFVYSREPTDADQLAALAYESCYKQKISSEA